MTIQVERAFGLEALGIVRSGRVHWNLSPAALYEQALARGEASLAAEGPLVARTGQHTGRSPNDKFVVQGAVERAARALGRREPPIDEAKFDALHSDMMAYLQDKELFVLDAWAGTDPSYKMPIRVVNEFAWHNLFARNMFLPENDPAKRAEHRPEFTVIDAPNFKADPARHGTRSDVFILVHFGRKLVLIGGTHYAGEIKKSIFTILNYTLPLQGVLSMHCSANIGADGDTALFFGLSGTGKTTLSSDPAPAAHRRRRARLERHRRLQLRGRLLRQGDQAVGGGRAADLRDDAALRHDPRERGHRSRHAHARPRRRVADREHARLLSDRRSSTTPSSSGRGGHPTQRRHADGRRLRRAAADRAADAGRRRCITSSRATRRAWPAPRRA